mgnify:CR=1 FL=1
MKGTVKAICISEKKGTRKHTVPSAELIPDHGIKGDAHAGRWHRQVSLLASESIDTMREAMPYLNPGDFAENILTEGIELKRLPVGTLLTVGETVLAITQIGKECHADCEIKKQTGTYVMPTDGVFTKVIVGGTIHVNDPITMLR